MIFTLWLLSKLSLQIGFTQIKGITNKGNNGTVLWQTAVNVPEKTLLFKSSKASDVTALFGKNVRSSAALMARSSQHCRPRIWLPRRRKSADQ